MQLRIKRGILFLLAAAFLVVSAGCPNSTAILAGNGTMQVDIVMVNPSRFDEGFFNINRILVRPVDSGASAAIGSGRELLLLPFSVFVDTTIESVDRSFLDPSHLSQGTYEIVELRLDSLFFFDSTFPPDPSTCESYQSFYSPVETFAIQFATPPRFTVVNGEDTSFTLTVDVTQMVATLHDAYTCSPGCGAFCISNFNAAQFAANTGSYLTFE